MINYANADSTWRHQLHGVNVVRNLTTLILTKPLSDAGGRDKHCSALTRFLLYLSPAGVGRTFQDKKEGESVSTSAASPESAVFRSQKTLVEREANKVNKKGRQTR